MTMITNSSSVPVVAQHAVEPIMADFVHDDGFEKPKPIGRAEIDDGQIRIFHPGASGHIAVHNGDLFVRVIAVMPAIMF
jgi:hypothetical protein